MSKPARRTLPAKRRRFGVRHGDEPPLTLDEFDDRIVEAARIIRWALFHRNNRAFRRTAMAAARAIAGNGSDVVQEVVVNMRCRLSRRPIYCGFSTAIVNMSRWTTFRLLSQNKKLQCDWRWPSSYEMAWDDGLPDVMESVVKTLTYREREIIRLRYGLGDGYSYTLEGTGRIFKVTREVIRQIEYKALKKLQHPTRSDRLAPFVNKIK